MKYKMMIEWQDASKELPNESGEYLVLTKSAHFVELDYSAKHKKWNVFDRHSADEVAGFEIEVIAWSDANGNEIARWLGTLGGER